MDEIERLAREIRDLLPVGCTNADYTAVLKIATTIEGKDSRATIVKFADMALAESLRRVEAFSKINSLITYIMDERSRKH